VGEIPWLVTAEHGVGDGKQSAHVDANGKRDIADFGKLDKDNQKWSVFSLLDYPDMATVAFSSRGVNQAGDHDRTPGNP
jgi:hypothetical protein